MPVTEKSVMISTNIKWNRKIEADTGLVFILNEIKWSKDISWHTQYDTLQADSGILFW